MTKDSFAKNIYRLRKERNWSQQELADAAGVGYQTVFRSEAGTFPSVQNLIKIAKALGTTESALIGTTEIKSGIDLPPQVVDAIRITIRDSVQQTLAQQAAPPPPKPEEETHEQVYFRMLKEYEKLAKEKMPNRDFFKMLRFFLEDHPEIVLGQAGFDQILGKPAFSESPQRPIIENRKTTHDYHTDRKVRKAR